MKKLRKALVGKPLIRMPSRRRGRPGLLPDAMARQLAFAPRRPDPVPAVRDFPRSDRQ